MEGTSRDVQASTWRSRRLVLADDAMGFSMHDTLIHAGTTTVIEYKNHFEAVYCIEGEGSIKTLPDGATHRIAPGMLYALDKHDRHELRAERELRLVCVFAPALHGTETHDADGSYPVLAPSKR